MRAKLKKYFGYTDFRPLQEEIIKQVLAKKDTFILMPTGGGKSLCYQLPSVMQQGLTVVISPLISLMKDQVDSLNDNGIPATFINSSLDYAEISDIKSELLEKKYRLLYVAPERLVLPQFLDFLKSLEIGLFAVDEAHCISEWGHDFRPEYRGLVVLKENFPDIPVAALTATATPVVQKDVIELLKMKKPDTFQASFNRENLVYRVLQKGDTYQRICDYLNAHPNESGIIYCQSRKTVESVAEKLRADGFRALPYHAGMESTNRSKNQDQFIKDNAEIIVATIAFGMGIDKPNVRFVIHYDLPKNIESYYQQTGRAGRDGLKSDCILYYSYGDKAKIEYFINNMEKPHERKIAYNKLSQMIHYCDTLVCRRRVLLEYFGEEFTQDNCGACDNCLRKDDESGKFDGTVIAQKLLSCVYRMDQRFGMTYVIDVLRGSKSERIFHNRHQFLSTYGIGSDISKKQWQVFARELMQQGLLVIEGGEYPVLKLTKKSIDVLFKKEKVFLTPYVEYKAKKVSDDTLDYDRGLFERLRQLRKRIADEQNVPPYVVFHDRTLRDMSRQIPESWNDLKNIFGMGESKLKRYGPRFLKEIVGYIQQTKSGI